jgi:hypothetical protein
MHLLFYDFQPIRENGQRMFFFLFLIIFLSQSIFRVFFQKLLIQSTAPHPPSHPISSSVHLKVNSFLIRQD